MAGSYYNTYGSRMPYAGPNRDMTGDPAFEQWRQRQFSSQPFSGPNDPLFKMPTQRTGGASGNPFDRLKAEADPRDILQSPLYKRLQEISGGTPGQDAAKGTLTPAIGELQKMLSTTDPLGVAQLGNVVRQKGMTSLREAGAGARRRVEEAFGGIGGAADSSGLEWMKDMLRVQEAGGLGEVNRQGTEADIAGSQATAQFLQGIAQALANIGLGQGQLALGDTGSQISAAQGGLTAESFARNTWADVFSRLLHEQMRPQQKRPIGGYDKNGDPIYDYNPFPGQSSFGEYLTGRNF